MFRFSIPIIVLVCFSACKEATNPKKVLTNEEYVDGLLTSQEVQIKQNWSEYKYVNDTAFKFGYRYICFKATYNGDLVKYECALHFTDTVNKTVFQLNKLPPGKSEWTEEDHLDFVAISLLINDKPYQVPLDLPEKATQELFDLLKDDTSHGKVAFDIEAILIDSVNRHPVKPLLLIKNVKKI